MAATNVIARALAERQHPAPTLPDAPLGEEPRESGAALRRGLRPTPLEAEQPTVEPDEIPMLIADATHRYLADPLPSTMLLIATPAGTGKTTAMVQLAEAAAAESKRVLYAGPNHAFFQDILALAGRPAWWFEWQGRHGGDPENQLANPATCRWARQMDAWLARGYQARTFCLNSRICGSKYMHSSCRYYAQEQLATAIVYAQHQHVSLGHLLMERMSLLIGDELPISAFLSTTNGKPGWIIPPAFIVPKGMAPGSAIEQLLRNLRALATVRNTAWEGEELLTALGGADHVAATLEHARIDGAIADEPKLRSAESVHDAPYFHLFTLARLLGQEADEARAGRPYTRRVRVTPDGLVLLTRRVPRQLPAHIIWCDATGDPRLYEQLLGRPVQVLRPRVRLRGRVHQVYASLNNKGSLLEGNQPAQMTSATLPDGPERQGRAQASPEKTDKLRRQIAQIIRRGGYQRPAVISYKGLVDGLLPEGADGGHFGAQRGTNRYQHCDCLIVIGAQQPTTAAIVDTAAQIFHTRTAPFDTTWSVLDRPYAGQPWSWPIGGFWNDPDLQALLDQFRESELIQAVHRARPIRRAVDVWLLTNVPLPHLPVELVTLAALFDAPADVDPYRWPEVVAFATERLERVGLVTSADLVAAKLCQQTAAAKYIRALAGQHDGWQIVTAPAAGRGKPPIGIVKPKAGVEYSLSS